MNPLLDPVLRPGELEAVGRRILELASADTVRIALTHTARGVTRVQRNRVHTNNDGSALTLRLTTQFGSQGAVMVVCNQVDETSLRQVVAYAERLAHAQLGDRAGVHMPLRPRSVPPGTVWHAETEAALTTTRQTVLPTLLQAVARAKLVASAFVGVAVRSLLMMTRDGLNVSGQETDAEITLTAWTPDGSGIGWAGQAARRWSHLDPATIAQQAIDLASTGAHPVAIEPGRRTVILGPAAVAQFAHLMPYAWAVGSTLQGLTPFSGGRGEGGTKLGELVMDRRVTITSDPADPEGGVLPIYRDGEDGSAIVPMTWVEQGILRNLAFDPGSAAAMGVQPANEVPYALRLGGGTATIESMIAACREGLYVNRVANVELVSGPSGLMSGVTQGGCFLVKDGRITKPVKNLRFVDSPFIFLNNLIEIGAPHRAALGYTPGNEEWPLPPVIVPPVMVRDFNFTMLADAV